MVRKRLLTEQLTGATPAPGAKDIAAMATVLMTSEAAAHPIDNLFDSRRGPGASRTQELQLSASRDGGQTYQELLRQEYTFSPPGTTFEREDWSITADGVTHLRLAITPDKGGNPCRATLTSLVVR